ncbi:acetylornithine transaminase [Teredinibacter turnerae T7901]|uniref:Acetylornithine aminotransferase n=1 Tax=Teredinibacter turnerae (strain ATCC 39867 / T7901) TaxID=377629 RepID=C5BPC9_TERTT|nr:acetylornithine transaminase [Teredinibacter turnerae]ACR11020.1 acetylornithine transaminase [Teredinibacter turnerae T7901]
MSDSALMNTYGERTTTLVKGDGAYLWDSEGNRYLDALSGIAVCGLGYNHPAVTRAIAEQAEKLIHCSNLYLIEPQQALGQILVDTSGMEKVFFSNSGAEANEAALKIARKFGQQKGISHPHVITADRSFHGRTMATLSATGNTKVKQGFEPLVEGFSHVPYNDVDAIKAAATANTVAIMVEPVQGEGGVNVPAPDYLNALRELCDSNDWLLILDEIQTGNGRTGRFFAYQHNNILPDVVTTAKGLGNGVPIGACLARGKAAEILQPGNHGSTFGGNPLVCNAGLAATKTLLEQDLMTRAAALGEMMLTQFRETLSDVACVVDIRGKGLMIGIELDQPCGDLVAQAKQKGVLINVTAGNTIRLLPPLIISDEQARTIVDTVVDLIKQ